MGNKVLDRFAVILLLGLCVIWGLQQVAIKFALEGISPMMQAGLRSIGATILLCLWMRWRGVKIFERDGTAWWGLLASLLFSGEFLLLYWALEYTTTSRGVVFLYTSPFIVALGVHFFVPGERLRLLQVIGLCCAFGGIVVAFGDNGGVGDTLIGDMMALLAAVFWGATTVVIKASPQRRLPAERVLLYQLAGSAIALPLLSLAFGEAGVTSVTVPVIASMLFQIVMVAFVSYLAWFWLIHRYQASKISSFGFFSPLFGVFFGFLIMDEAITPVFIVALVLVAAGIYLVNKPQAVKQTVVDKSSLPES